MKSTEQTVDHTSDDLAWLLDQHDYEFYDILTFYMREGEFFFLSPST